METHVLGFLRASLCWLVAGVTLGLTMATYPPFLIYRTVHIHLLLLGFVTMMIAGVAYHVFPRFAATPLHSRGLARIHLVLANLGLVLLATGFAVRAHGSVVMRPLLAAGGLCSAAGAYCLAYNLWRTLDRAAILPTRLPPLRPIPTVEPGGR